MMLSVSVSFVSVVLHILCNLKWNQDMPLIWKNRITKLLYLQLKPNLTKVFPGRCIKYLFLASEFVIFFLLKNMTKYDKHSKKIFPNFKKECFKIPKLFLNDLGFSTFVYSMYILILFSQFIGFTGGGEGGGGSLWMSSLKRSTSCLH